MFVHNILPTQQYSKQYSTFKILLRLCDSNDHRAMHWGPWVYVYISELGAASFCTLCTFEESKGKCVLCALTASRIPGSSSTCGTSSTCVEACIQRNRIDIWLWKFKCPSPVPLNLNYNLPIWLITMLKNWQSKLLHKPKPVVNMSFMWVLVQHPEVQRLDCVNNVRYDTQ